jgi:MFS transporter, BCD family, chlorophyll transporter
MSPISKKMAQMWTSFGPRFLPFADVATPDLPLGRLLRLSLFQVSVGMALVLLVGTLNRVMIVEMQVPASLVGVMVALPLIFAPFRALIGFRSDTYRSALGWKRVPFIWKGTLLQFGGFAMMPFALLVLAGMGQAGAAPAWIGQLGAAIAFLLVGAGIHITQTVGLALATDLVPNESQPKVVGLMYVMLLLGMMVSALVFGVILADFSPGRLIQVIQGVALTTLILNVISLWKQEPRQRGAANSPAEAESFIKSWRLFCQGGNATRRLVVVGLGTMAFTMEDILLEPYGGEILGMGVGATTSLTATLAIGGLLGFGLASQILGRGADPFRMASAGAWAGVPAFGLVMLSAPLHMPWLFGLGILLIGFGAGLFGHGTLTATMNLAPRHQRGLALGAWGAVQATAAGVGMALGGILRDLVAMVSNVYTGYMFVYSLEVLMLLAALVAMAPLVKRKKGLVTAA